MGSGKRASGIRPAKEKLPGRKKLLTGFGGSDIKVGRCDVGKKRSRMSFLVEKSVDR